MSAFRRYIGIDYSGAETPESSLKGLRVYCAVGEYAANEVPPPLLLLLYAVGAADGFTQRAIRRACGGRESASLYHRAK